MYINIALNAYLLQSINNLEKNYIIFQKEILQSMKYI